MSAKDEIDDTFINDDNVNSGAAESDGEPLPDESGTDSKDVENEPIPDLKETDEPVPEEAPKENEKNEEGAAAPEDATETPESEEGRAEADEHLKSKPEDDSLMKSLEAEVKVDVDEAEAARREADERSVFVKNVHFRTKEEELTAFFEERTSGHVKRITFVHDKITQKPTGIAYVEFESKDTVETALEMNGSEFKDRKLEIKPKRTNEHRFAARGRRDRMMRGGYPMPMMYPYGPYPPPYGYPYSPFSRGGRGGYRGH